MPKFLAIYPVDPPVNPEAVTPLAKKCKAGVSPDTYWVKSWLQYNGKGEITRVLCEWDAKDAESVYRSIIASLPELPPSEGIFQVSEIHGEDFR